MEREFNICSSVASLLCYVISLAFLICCLFMTD